MSETQPNTDEALKTIQLETARADLRLKELEIRASETQLNTDEALKTIQLETARADLRLKELEIRYKPGPWKSIFTNPITIGAFLTAYVTIATTYFSITSSRDQRKIDAEKAISSLMLQSHQAQNNLILEAIKTGDPNRAAVNLRFLLDLGLFADSEVEKRIGTYLDKRRIGEGPTFPAPNPAAPKPP